MGWMGSARPRMSLGLISYGWLVIWKVGWGLKMGWMGQQEWIWGFDGYLACVNWDGLDLRE